ncbi:MAG TPA: sigma-70 family RNA polymerase sigma factor [Verrucomicrobiae bacterium]|nr:sigma-70 family RNA polymerase sigma factor [Verrucomicrobiae bacterium]
MSGETGLERLYDEHAQLLFGYLLNFTRSESDTRDALQDVFVKLASDPELLRTARNPRAFLIRLAHNTAVDLMRRRRARDKHLEQFETGRVSIFQKDPDPDQNAFQERLAEALGTLPPEQREVVHLKLWEEFTFEQIGLALGISQNTAASRYRYGLDKLRELLRPFYEQMK